MTLTPTIEPASSGSCKKGTLYTSVGNAFGDAADRLPGVMYFCDTAQNWITVGSVSGSWTFNSVTHALYPTDTSTDVKIGIGTTSPVMQLQVNGSAPNTVEGILSTGTFGAQTLPAGVSGLGTRLLWYPGKAAFRAGTVTGAQWDDGNIGNYSVAMGFDNSARGANSVISGGSGNTINAGATHATILGGNANTTTGDYSFVGGQNMVLSAAADRTFLWGHAGAPTTITRPDYFMIYSGKLRVNSGITPYVASLLPVAGFTPNFEIIADATDNIADINLQGAINPIGRINFGTTAGAFPPLISSIMGGNNGDITFYVQAPLIPSGNRFVFSKDTNDNPIIAMRSEGGTTEYVPTSPTNSTRILRGRINADCLSIGAGGDAGQFTITNLAGLGTCQVNFNTAFADTPIISITPFHYLSGSDFAVTAAVKNPGTGSFQVYTMRIPTTAAGPAVLEDIEFFFTAIGQKPNF